MKEIQREDDFGWGSSLFERKLKEASVVDRRYIYYSLF